jgi:hypothetical protein
MSAWCITITTERAAALARLQSMQHMSRHGAVWILAVNAEITRCMQKENDWVMEESSLDSSAGTAVSPAKILRYFTKPEIPPPFFAHAEMLPVHTAVIPDHSTRKQPAPSTGTKLEPHRWSVTLQSFWVLGNALHSLGQVSMLVLCGGSRSGVASA